MRFSRDLLLVVLAALVPASAMPQALTSLASLRVSYNTRKVTANPQGELRAQIDALDNEIAAAARLGRTGELRRLFAKGMTLLAGRPWNDVADFAGSLVIRSDRVVVDSANPYTLRLEQIYSPSIELPHALTAKVRLRKRPAPGPPAQPADLVKELGTFDGVGRDLRDAPFFIDVDVAGMPDGPYQLQVEMFDDAKALGAATLAVTLQKGLDAALSRLAAAAKTARPSARADILFPFDRIRNINRGRLALGNFNVADELTAASAIVVASKDHKDAYAGRTGDFKRHYLLETASEIMPYRVYVPTTYTRTRAFPLVIALHGLGGTEDSMFVGYDKKLPELAEQHEYVVAAPLGYRVDGSYGYGLGQPPADPAARRTQEFSEQDVLQVLDRVKEQYKIDDSRIYLLGHSMGAIGTWKLAAKYPDIWAGLAPISGSGAPATIEKFKHIPEIVIHGDADPTVPVSGSRTMVAKMKELGVEVTYIEVPGGNHASVAAPNLPAIFDFFDAHRKPSRSTQ